MKLRQILIVLLTLVLVPVGLSALIYYRSVSSVIESEVSAGLEVVAEQYVKEVNYKINLYRNFASLIEINPGIQESIGAFHDSGMLDVEGYRKFINTMSAIQSMSSYNEFEYIKLYHLREGAFHQAFANRFGFRDESEFFLYDDIKKRRLLLLSSAYDGDRMILLKSISSLSGYNRLDIIGLIAISIGKSDVFEPVRTHSGDNPFGLFIVQGKDELLYTSMENPYRWEDLADQSAAGANDRLVMQRKLDYHGMSAVFVFPLGQIRDRVRSTTGAIGVVTALLVGFCSYLIFLYARSLSDRHNRQIISAREAELKALQMQVNPHFMYNTLGCINSLAIMGGHEGISIIAQKLSSMLRYNTVLSTTEDVTLLEELTQAMHYIDIQKIRFGNKVDLLTDIPEELLGLRMLKFILQPIVENYVRHGFRDTGRYTFAEITADIVDNALVIKVQDDGMGIEPEELRAVNETLSREAADTSVNGRGSIGLENVNARIRLKYGKPYGLHVDSQVDVGTTVTIRLPVIRS